MDDATDEKMYDYDNHRLMLFYLRADRDTIVEVMITRCDASELMSRAYPIRHGNLKVRSEACAC